MVEVVKREVDDGRGRAPAVLLGSRQVLRGPRRSTSGSCARLLGCGLADVADGLGASRRRGRALQHGELVEGDAGELLVEEEDGAEPREAVSERGGRRAPEHEGPKRRRRPPAKRIRFGPSGSGRSFGDDEACANEGTCTVATEEDEGIHQEALQDRKQEQEVVQDSAANEALPTKTATAKDSLARDGSERVLHQHAQHAFAHLCRGRSARPER